jgi:ABC-type iron transport system FetAB ATPase subunit
LPLKWKDNIILPFLSYKKKLNKKRLNYLIDTFNVSFLEKDIENLSSWEKERIWLIKAFIHQPEIVILDEAWNHLDKNLKTKLENLINKYSQNHIVVLTSHLNRENLKINLKLCLEK